MAPPADRTLSSRYELKYWLPPQLVPEVRRHLRPFTRPDRFARNRPGYRYPISSLYLDNAGFDLYRTTVEGHKNRFKLRVRAYDDDPARPVFLEIKKRLDQVVRKRRARVPRELAEHLLRGEALPPMDPALAAPDIEEFVQSIRRLAARPILRIRYQREAYESTGRDPVRVTFDTKIEHVVTRGSNLSLKGPGWRATPTEGVILEIKFTDLCPTWVQGMVRSLGLQRVSIPKYVLSLSRTFALDGKAPFFSGIAERA